MQNPGPTGAQGPSGLPVTTQTDVTASRVLGTTYRNATTSPITVSAVVSNGTPTTQISVIGATGPVSASVQVSIDGGVTDATGYGYYTATFIVLPNYYYKVSATNGTLNYWIEWS